MTADCCSTDRQDKNPDIAVIGAGSAGFSAAIRAAELGAQVTLIGGGIIGGTCVNIGCVPSKTMIRATETLHQAHTAARFNGIRTQAELVDWRALVAQKNELVGALRQVKYADLLPAYSAISYVEGQARLTEDGISVNGASYKPGKIILATGASLSAPPIEGLGEVPWLDSTAALDLETLPASLIVIGGGAVGCELGQMFARAGSKVTILCRSRLLPDFEPEIGAALTNYLDAEGIEVRCGIGYRSVRRLNHGIALSIEEATGHSNTIDAEALLVATGRRPNTSDLGLKEAGVMLDAKGAIRIDDRMRTTKPGIYAAGDVTGQDMFVYMAAYGAKIAVENALNSDGRRYDASAMPEVVFTDPQSARVGLTEDMARKRGLDIHTSILSLDQVPRALAARDTRGLVKLVAERVSGRLVGAHMLAPEAGDSIQTMALAIGQGLTVTDLTDVIFPYLTTVEAFKLAALGFTKDIRKLSCCAG